MIERLASPLPFIKENRLTKVIAEIANHLLIPSVEMEGQENLKKAQELAGEPRTKLIFTPNHISNADASVLSRALRKNGFHDLADNLVFIQGIKLDKHPINNRFTKAFKVIKTWPKNLPAVTRDEQVERRVTLVKASKDARTSLQAGYHLVIFLEGGRSYEGSLKEADASAIHFFKMDKDWDTIALPVGIWGTEKVMPPHKIPRPSLEVHVRFGEPINVSSLMRENDLRGKQMYGAIIDRLMRKGIAPILPPQYRGIYS